MTGAVLPVPRERVSGGKLRLFGAAGGFLRRVDAQQADELLGAGLAEMRGRDLRLVKVERHNQDGSYQQQLDGMHPTKAETPTNTRNTYAFRSVVLPG